MSLETAEDFQVALDDWGEALQFRKDENSAARHFRGIVDREPPQVIDGAPEGLAYAMVITTPNSAAAGISSGELDEGGNQVLIAPRIGTAAKWMNVNLIGHDERVIRLGLTGG